MLCSHDHCAHLHLITCILIQGEAGAIFLNVGPPMAVGLLHRFWLPAMETQSC